MHVVIVIPVGPQWGRALKWSGAFIFKVCYDPENDRLVYS